MRRAEDRLNENKYHLIFNNCEHFVTEVLKPGKGKSEQVKNASFRSGELLHAASYLQHSVSINFLKIYKNPRFSFHEFSKVYEDQRLSFHDFFEIYEDPSLSFHDFSEIYEFIRW